MFEFRLEQYSNDKVAQKLIETEKFNLTWI